MSQGRTIRNLQFSDQKLVGKGSYAHVYQVLHEGRTKVLKRQAIRRNKVDPALKNGDDIKRIQHEMDILDLFADKGVPNIPYYYGGLMLENYGYILLQFCEKKSYKEAFIDNQSSIISLKIQLRMVKEVLEALAFLINLGYIHRDLKPANILIDNNDHAKLADFGFAEKIEAVIHPETGTPLYLAPDVILYSSKVIDSCIIGECSEVYSAGLTFWSMFARKEPYQHIHSYAAFKNHIASGQREVIPSNWPQSIRQMIWKSWNEDPKQRPTFNEMLGVVNGQYLSLGK